MLHKHAQDTGAHGDGNRNGLERLKVDWCDQHPVPQRKEWDGVRSPHPAGSVDTRRVCGACDATSEPLALVYFRELTSFHN